MESVKIAKRNDCTVQLAFDPVCSVQSDHRIAIAGFCISFNQFVMPTWPAFIP